MALPLLCNMLKVVEGVGFCTLMNASVPDLCLFGMKSIFLDERGEVFWGLMLLTFLTLYFPFASLVNLLFFQMLLGQHLGSFVEVFEILKYQPYLFPSLMASSIVIAFSTLN